MARGGVPGGATWLLPRECALFGGEGSGRDVFGGVVAGLGCSGHAACGTAQHRQGRQGEAMAAGAVTLGTRQGKGTPGLKPCSLTFVGVGRGYRRMPYNARRLRGGVSLADPVMQRAGWRPGRFLFRAMHLSRAAACSTHVDGRRYGRWGRGGAGYSSQRQRRGTCLNEIAWLFEGHHRALRAMSH